MRRRLAGLLRCVTLLVVVGACSRKEEPAREGAKEAASSPRAATAQVKLVLNWVAEPEFGGFY